MGVVACLTGAVLAAVLLHLAEAKPAPEARIQQGDGTSVIVSSPVQFRSDAAALRVTLPFTVGSLHPRSYHVFFVGCLDDIRLNGRDVSAPFTLPLCNGDSGITLDFSEAVKAGDNILMASLRDAAEWHRFSLTLQASRSDPLILACAAAIALFLILATATLQRKFLSRRRAEMLILWIFLTGVLLRIAYVLATPWNIRGPDWLGHAQYMRYLLLFKNVPPESWGWETHQPPLYYILGALWASGLKFLGATLPGGSLTTVIGTLQGWSLVCSVLQLLLMLRIGTLLFPKGKNNLALLFYGMIAASFPATIFFASRINNDILAFLFVLIAFLSLLRWWAFPSRRDWLTLSIALGLGILTKSTVIPLLPVAGISLLCHPTLSPTKKTRYALSLAGILTILDGWFLLDRYWFAARALIGNTGPLVTMKVETTFANLIVFNPLRILFYPSLTYNSPGTGREYVWEVLFRTALFGNAPTSMAPLPLILLLILTGTLLLPVIAAGFVQAWKNRSLPLPVFLCMIITLAAQLALRIAYPYASAVDFRYSPLLVVCLAAAAAVAATQSRSGWKICCQIILCSFLFLTTIFPLIIFLWS